MFQKKPCGDLQSPQGFYFRWTDFIDGKKLPEIIEALTLR
jgi:hypothetical protein